MNRKYPREIIQSLYFKGLVFNPASQIPEHDCRIIVMAVNKSYNFGNPQMMTGYFQHKYYDTVINAFRVANGGTTWEVTHWAYAPDPVDSNGRYL